MAAGAKGPQARSADQIVEFLNPMGGCIGQGNDDLIELPGPAFEQAFGHANDGYLVDAAVPLLNIVIKEGHDGSSGLFSQQQLAGELAPGAARANDPHAHW